MMREIQISRFRHKKTKCTNLCLFVKKKKKKKTWSFQLIHTENNEKGGKSRFSHKVIHIIHIKTYVFGGLLYNKKRTDVLVSYDKNANMSKKLG